MKSILWLAALGAALYFGYQWWEQNSPRLSRAPESEGRADSYGGGPVREWQRAPDTMMDMQSSMGGGGSSATSARGTVKDRLGGK